MKMQLRKGELKMKRLLTLMLALVVVLAGCVQTKSDVSGEKDSGDTKGGGNERQGDD